MNEPPLPPRKPEKLLISYDLNRPEDSSDYKKLKAKLEDLGAKRVLQSQWALATNQSPRQILDQLSGFFIDGNDRLLVSALGAFEAVRLLVDLDDL